MSDQHQPEQSNKPLTPVAISNSSAKWKSYVLLAIGSVIAFGGLAFHHFTQNQPSKAVHEETESTISNLPMPDLSLVKAQVAEMQRAIASNTMAVSSLSPAEEEARKLRKMRMVAPSAVYSAGAVSGRATTNDGVTKQNGNVFGGEGQGDSNASFMSQVSQSNVAHATATRIAHPDRTLAQGTMIQATLETRIVSDLPGMVRAVTSEDIYAEDGGQVLLPKGSRLVGQYASAVAQGQQRVFVVWQRAIRPDHIDIQLNSPGTDALGAAGMLSDKTDRHFVEQFGMAALLSVISAGAANVGVKPQDQLNSASAYREAISNSFAQSAQTTLSNKGTINPTLYINQGKVISVFVARDLDFSTEIAGSK